MRKALAAGLIFAAAAILLVLPRISPGGASAPAPAGGGKAETGPPPLTASEARSSGPTLPIDPAALRDQAVEWRRKAREDSAFLGHLRQLVLDEAASSTARELAAFVLGTLTDREGHDALARALEVSRDPRWTRTLLLALGCDRTSGEDDDIFALPDSPRVQAVPLGLSVSIRGAIDASAIRGPMITRLADAQDAGVRWAAALALADSAIHTEVRTAFFKALPGERDPAAQGEFAKALAEWAATQPADTEDRPRVFSALFEGADVPDAAALRLRSESGLKRMAWTSPEIQLMTVRIESGNLDQRRWAISVLSAAAARRETPDRDAIFESIARASGSAAEAKVREAAVTGLPSFADQPRTTGLLIASLGDPAWHVRSAAARALGKVGGSADVVAALQRSEREDPDERVRRAAAEVRRAMGSK